jgi:hypothetical protein
MLINELHTACRANRARADGVDRLRGTAIAARRMNRSRE